MEKIMGKIFNIITLRLSLMILIGIFIIAYISLVVKKNPQKRKQSYEIACFLMLLNIIVSVVIPYNKIFKFSSVEKAFHFSYPSGKIVYKKEFENLAFVYGASTYTSEKENGFPGIFALYEKDGKTWKIEQDGNENIMSEICIKSKKTRKEYNAYKLSNKGKNITGLFITDFIRKPTLSINTKITDSYNTKYEGLDSLYCDYCNYGTYMFFGILTEEISNDYYIEIDGIKYEIELLKDM